MARLSNEACLTCAWQACVYMTQVCTIRKPRWQQDSLAPKHRPTCLEALTNDFADLVVHLRQFVLHLPAVDSVGVPRMVHTQPMGNQQVPAVRALQKRYQVLHGQSINHR
jgi:hypothetical protein